MACLRRGCLRPVEAGSACPASKMRYAEGMTRTDEKVRYLPESKSEALTPLSAASGVENVLRILEGRWKLVILFHLFGGKVLRFSDLERAIPAISQKMLIQQCGRWRPTASSAASRTTKCLPKSSIASSIGARRSARLSTPC